MPSVDPSGARLRGSGVRFCRCADHGCPDHRGTNHHRPDHCGSVDRRPDFRGPVNSGPRNSVPDDLGSNHRGTHHLCSDHLAAHHLGAHYFGSDHRGPHPGALHPGSLDLGPGHTDDDVSTTNPAANKHASAHGRAANRSTHVAATNATAGAFRTAHSKPRYHGADRPADPQPADGRPNDDNPDTAWGDVFADPWTDHQSPHDTVPDQLGAFAEPGVIVPDHVAFRTATACHAFRATADRPVNLDGNGIPDRSPSHLGVSRFDNRRSDLGR